MSLRYTNGLQPDLEDISALHSTDPQGGCLAASSISALVDLNAGMPQVIDLNVGISQVNPPAVTAYVAQANWATPSGGSPNVKVVSIEPNPGSTNTIITNRSMNSCASNSGTRETVCTGNGNLVYTITHNPTTMTDTVKSVHPTSASGQIRFSHGTCVNCEVAMDVVNDRAVIGLSRGSQRGGFQILDLNTDTLGMPINSAAPTRNVFPANTNISEGILVDGSRNLILSPTENGDFELVMPEINVFPLSPLSPLPQNPTVSLTSATQDLALGGPGVNSISPNPFLTRLLEQRVDSQEAFDSAAEDCATGIAVASMERHVPALYLTDLTQIKSTGFSPAQWSAPASFQTFSDDLLPNLEGGGVQIAPGTHTGVIIDEGGSNIVAISLPETNTGGTPNLVDRVGCAVGDGFQFGFDPHGVTAYQTPDGSFHAIALFVNATANTIARVDLTSMLDQNVVPPNGNNFCADGALATIGTPVITFIN